MNSGKRIAPGATSMTYGKSEVRRRLLNVPPLFVVFSSIKMWQTFLSTSKQYLVDRLFLFTFYINKAVHSIMCGWALINWLLSVVQQTVIIRKVTACFDRCFCVSLMHYKNLYISS